MRGKPELRQSIAAVAQPADRRARRQPGAPRRRRERRGRAHTAVDLSHDAVSRYVDVRAAVSGRGVDAVPADVRDRLRRCTSRSSTTPRSSRPSADEQSPLSAFLALAAAAAVGIYLLLQAAFGSWRLASLVFATLPMALRAAAWS